MNSRTALYYCPEWNLKIFEGSQGDEDEDNKESKKEYTLLCDWVKQQLGDKVAKVQISKRLSLSTCVLVSGKFGWSANMKRLMKAQTLGDTSRLEFMRRRRIFEINPDHQGLESRQSSRIGWQNLQDDDNCPWWEMGEVRH
ncbi:hypothetical protein ABZP36_029924 [Zizania latifolia]